MVKEVIRSIRENGWSKETQQQVRELVVNQPTGRFTYYDLHKCFYEEVTVDQVCEVLSNLTWYSKHVPYAGRRKRTAEDIERVYGNVLHTNGEHHREFIDSEELVEFWCGTSLTRARAFIACGDGYTKLERPVYSDEFFTEYGIQVMLEDFRACDYARRQAYPLNDRPAVIHGFIKAKYLFGANNFNEYGIPCEYYSHMKNVEII